MDEQNSKELEIGIWYAAFAYIFWGILPLYWKLLEKIPAVEILAHRIVWSFVFIICLLAVYKKWDLLLRNIKEIIQSRVQFFAVLASSILISTNWLVCIWAVNSDHIIETSLGYYINPLISVLLGMLFLKEKLSFWQFVSFALATVGVVILTIQYGQFPWIALTLAISFGLYGLTKKVTKLDSMIGLTFETMIVVPLAFVYLIFLAGKGNGSFGTSLSTTLLLIGAGVATALPLLWFAQGAKRIPLSMVGFLQYIAPSISLLLGIFVYHEHFSKTHFVSFLFIWTALTLFSLAKSKWLLTFQPKIGKKSMNA
jgi:chloramphenicol-sensitive protein RarD